MKILLTNDDGYRAPGLRALYRELAARGHEVIICAPDRERSAASHSFTITSPLKPRMFIEDDISGYHVDGTPADCARLGVYMFTDVDLVISGINHGANAGGACVYSGTVAAAMEAAMCGYPALATSLASFTAKDFSAPARITAAVAEWMPAHPLPIGVIYNLNAPDLPYEKIKGLRKATLSTLFIGEAKYEKRRAPYGFDYYWLTDGEDIPMTDPECDSLLLKAGWATISPVTWNMIHPGGMDSIEDINL